MTMHWKNSCIPLTLLALWVIAVSATNSAQAADTENFPPLWNVNTPVPAITELAPLNDVQLHTIQAREPEKDGYIWLHGVALEWHKGNLYTSFGHNKGQENTATEEARGSVSSDGGKSWSDVVTIDASTDSELAISHGVLLSEKGQLWSFAGCFYGNRKRIHMRAYLLDEATGTWNAKGVVAEDGFWPMDEPTRMKDGNWIIGGLRVGGTNPAAVAISHGDNLLKWDVVVIPQSEELGVTWGESTVLVDGKHITNISRYGARSNALVSHSSDYGRTWSLQR